MQTVKLDKMALDIGCSDKKRDGFIGMDNRICAGVDVIHDIEETPWPFDDAEFYAINASHVLEHVKPWLIFEVFNEAWRVLQVGGGMDVRVPIGLAYKLDPTHMIEFNIGSFLHFDKDQKLYDVYKPKPWKIIFTEISHEKQQIRVILKKEAE